MDCWTNDRPLTTSSDRTVRLWKVTEGSHLVYRCSNSSAECVQELTDEAFVTGSQDGSIELWKHSQKKRVAYVKGAHGYDEKSSSARWVCSLASLKMSDFVVSGSLDGFLRCWKMDVESRTISPITSVPLSGVVNGLALSSRLLVAGVGREHRLGRWWNVKGARDNVVVMRLPDSIAD